MAFFTSEGIGIAYEVYGEGIPLLLIHGFASSGKVNWVDTGWVEELTGAGYQAITIDNRGHGQSEKLYDSSLYSARSMAHDAVNLVKHLNLGSAVFIGYSMGARISAFAAIDSPATVRAIVFGGLGINMVKGMADSEEIIAGLNAASLSEVTHKTGRQFRIFAEHTGSDLKALAACMAASRAAITEDDVRGIGVPALVAVGSEDDVGGAPEPLAGLLPKGEVLVIERRDHMRATGDARFKRGVLAFLARHEALIRRP